MGILHPAVIEIALAARQGFDKGSHRFPSARAQPRGSLTVNRDKRLAHGDITGMLDGILVAGHEITIDRLPHGGDADLLQFIFLLVVIHVCKNTTI